MHQLSDTLQEYLATTQGKKNRLDHKQVQQYLQEQDEELYAWLLATGKGEKEQCKLGSGKDILVGLWLDLCIDNILPAPESSGKSTKPTFHWRFLEPSQTVRAPVTKKPRRERTSEQQTAGSGRDLARRWSFLSSQSEKSLEQLKIYKNQLPKDQRPMYSLTLQSLDRNINQLKKIVSEVTGY